MIIGVGFDIIETDRIQNAANNDLFYTKNFTEKEIAYFASRKYNMQTIAGNFAAKEAVLKCLECGLFDVPLSDIEVLRKQSGKPYINLYGKAMDKAQALGVCRVHISISHIRQYAAANAIAEGE
ncbi:MAG: holo-ACP synthase [Christensenellales bacterium]|jgi:holo-[acyl-carrier protein] synthase